MHDDLPSLTARRVAISRAAHQLYDEPKVFEDPLALRIVGVQCAQEIQTHRERFDTLLERHLRAFVAARSRIAESALAAAIRRGIAQYVILGAGLDTFAYRNAYPPSVLRVFEVDHPATQAWKRRQLSAADVVVPGSLTFVPVDFETQMLPGCLQRCGFRDDLPSAFSWLGVTMYLSREAVMSTLSYVARVLPRGSGIVFDYTVPPASIGVLRRIVVSAIMRRVAAAGEPWRTFFDPRELQAELSATGFDHVDDLGPTELNQQYFGDRSDGLQVGSVGHVMMART